jgi:hypothetical protein
VEIKNGFALHYIDEAYDVICDLNSQLRGKGCMLHYPQFIKMASCKLKFCEIRGHSFGCLLVVVIFQWQRFTLAPLPMIVR